MNDSDDEDEDVQRWRARTAAAPARPAMGSNNLRAQLISIADQYERTKLNEQSILNRRIQTLTAEKRAAETERNDVREKAQEKEKELEDKLETKEKELEDWKARAEKAEEATGATAKRALAMQFIVAELVSKWPQIPIYETPPEIEDDSASEDEDEDSDEEGEASLKLELDNGDDDDDEDEEIDEADEDESIDGVSGEESPAAKKKKKKKRPKRKKKKKASGVEDEESLAMSAAEGGDYVDGVNLPPKLPPSAAEVALAEAVSRASLDELPPPPPSSSSASSALSKKRGGGSVVQWRVPKVKRYEKVPMPPGLVLPNGLVTRDDFTELSGSAGITLKQLNKLQCLLEPSDPSFAGSSNDEELLAIVDDVLNGGLNACCGASGSLRVAKLLLAHGATPAYPSSQDFDASPIHRCVQFGHDNLFALLLTHKVNLNATDPVLGRTPLHFAAQYNRAVLAKLLVNKGATVDAVDNNGETATQIAERLKWKKVATILTDPSVLFWNFANRANKLYKAMEYEMAIATYEKSFALLDEVKPSPSAQNRATLYYNCARASANMGRQLEALKSCNHALSQVPKYLSALEQRAKSQLALYNYKAALDDATTLIAEGSDISTGPSSGVDLWTRIKRDASAKLTQSHFSLLDLNQRATPAEVKKAYRQQCIAWHPDKHVASEDAKHRAHIMFQRVNEAHEVLSDPTKRRSYEYSQRFAPSSSSTASSPSTSSPHKPASSYAGYRGGWPNKSQYDSDGDEDDDGF